MIHSMTGFGRHCETLGSEKVTVELKSLNSKALDLNVRMPLPLRAHEIEFRRLIGERLVRGKIEAYVQVESETLKTPAKINEPLVRAYISQIQAIASGDPLNELSLALKMPDALTHEKEEASEEQLPHFLSVLSRAIDELIAFRASEGAELWKDIRKRIEGIAFLLQEVESFDQSRKEGIRTRLRDAVSNLKEQLDENRFEQELIYYLEKYDITEEKVRLKNHLEFFTSTALEKAYNGKKLGFIAQEIGREVNTIGSKANDPQIQRLVVQMKDELEKIKEQLLNVL